jgi:hypothetical protein
MSTAHNNLETIKKTLQEVQSLLIELRKGKRKAETSTSETESESQLPPCKELMTQPTKLRTLQVIINNVAGVDKYKRKLEIIVNKMRDQNLDIFLGQEMNIKKKRHIFFFIFEKE